MSFLSLRHGGGVSNFRSVTFDADDYYVVTCKNTASGTVIYNEEHTPGTTVSITNVAAGSYEVTTSLFRKDDEMSLFRNSFVKSSSATATCTVKARETTAVNLNMPYPALCGWRMTGIEIPVPYYGVDNCFISYQGHHETGYDYWFTIMKISEEPSQESCSITVSVDGESATDTEPCIEYDALRNTLMFCLMDDVSKPTYQKIEEAVTANKDFTVTAVLDGDQYILTIPSDFYLMCDTYDAMVVGGVEIENYSTDSWFIGIGEDAFIFFFKDNPRLVVFPNTYYSAEDTNNGTKSIIDSVKFGTSGDAYTDLLFSQPDEEGDYTQGIGTYFDSVDDMKDSLSKALTSEGLTMKFTSAKNEELSFDTTLIAETAEALADWLGVTFPAHRPEGLFVGNINNPPFESGYRAANVNDIEQMIVDNNYGSNCLYSLNNNEQITAAQQIIAEGADYLLLSPAATTGWDTVLQNAKNAGVKVIFYDRKADVDESLYETFICLDMHLEGEKAVNWLAKQNLPVYNIVHLQGAMGSEAQIGRTSPLANMVSQNENWNLVCQETAVWSADNAKAIVEGVIHSGKQFNIIYAENDDMARGAVQALDEAGITHGVNGDIVIVSFDCNKWALKLVLDGKWNCDVQCNPFQAEYVNDVIAALEKGESVPKTIIVEDRVFDAGTITQEDVDTYGLGNY